MVTKLDKVLPKKQSKKIKSKETDEIINEHK